MRMTSESEEDVSTLVYQASDLLDKHQLIEAEQLYNRAITQLSSADSSGSGSFHYGSMDKCLVESFLGLAQIYTKRGRYSRSDESEWHRHYLQALTMQRQAVHAGRDALNRSDLDEENIAEWLRTTVDKAKHQLDVLEEMYSKSLQSRLLPLPIHKPYMARVDPKKQKAEMLNADWLTKLQSHLKTKMYSVEDEPLRRGSSVGSSEEDTKEVNNEVEQSKRRKVDFNRVQRAIMRMVKQISKDMRSKHIRKKLSEDTLKRAVSSEMLCMLTPQFDGDDMLSLFEHSIIEDDEGMNEVQQSGSETESGDRRIRNSSSAEFESDFSDETIDYRSPETEIHNGFRDTTSDKSRTSAKLGNSSATMNGGSARPRTLPTSGAIPYYIKGKGEVTPEMPLQSSLRPQSSSPGQPSKTISIIQQGSTPEVKSPMSSVPCTVYNKNPDFKLPGILRVWRGQKPKKTQSHTFMPHKLSFEEMSPLTETPRYAYNDYRNTIQEDPIQEIEKPITDRKLNTTLALILGKIGDRVRETGDLEHANDLYNHALGILQKHDADICSQDFKAVAHLLKSLAAIRCSKGDLVGGSQLMEDAVEMYHRHHGTTLNVDVVRVWLELGNAYMAEQCTDSTLVNYVMRTVKEKLEEELVCQEDVVDYTSDSESESGSSEGESYALNIHEAVGCFNQALIILRKLRKKHELHNEIYVEVLSKMADCCIILGDYEKAILCYEESMVLFQNTLGSTSLTVNAHVLAMLGITNFLLRNYPKAMTMFETAHILQQHIYGGEMHIEMSFTLTMLGITSYTQGLFHKCIAWCLKSYELSLEVYKDPSAGSTLNRWFTIQIVYTMGYAYSTLNLFDKSLHYLNISKDMVTLYAEAESKQYTKQMVAILKVMADVYTAMDEHENALKYYEEALQHAVNLGDENSATTLQNQLLNRMAGVHVSTKEYCTAAKYLEQALDCQKNVETSIKGDMFGVLKQLGVTYTLSGDLDKAIDCYLDCIEAYHEMNSGTPGPEMAKTLGNLAGLYHIKACLQEDDQFMNDLLMVAERYYKDALGADKSSPVSVQYANYLYHQGHTADALLIMLQYLWNKDVPDDNEIMYNGPEQAVLPVHLQQELDDIDEVSLDAMVFGHFLAILCYKELNIMKDADDSLEKLVKCVLSTDVAINYSILGYALMEMDMLIEAAEAFYESYLVDLDNDVALTNCQLCYITAAYMVIAKAVFNIWENVYQPFDESLIEPYQLPNAIPSRSKPLVVVNDAEDEVFYPTRDSGYYDHHEVGESMAQYSSTDKFATDLNTCRSFSNTSDHIDKGYTSSESLQKHSSFENIGKFKHDEEQLWEEETVVHTPPEILALLRKQNEIAATTFTTSKSVVIQSDEQRDESENLQSEITIDENSNPSESNGEAVHNSEVWTYSTDETVVATPPEILAILRKQDRSYDSSATEDKYAYNNGIEEDIQNGNGVHAETQNSEEVWYSEEVVETSPHILKLLQQQCTETKPNVTEKVCPLDQTIADLQQLAGKSHPSRSYHENSSLAPTPVIAMDISPEQEGAISTETWETVQVEEPPPDRIDALLKQNQEVQSELEDSLRAIESHNRRSPYSWNDTSTNLASDTVAENNNVEQSTDTSFSSYLSNLQEESSFIQGVKRKGSAMEYVTSKFPNIGKNTSTAKSPKIESVVVTPPKMECVQSVNVEETEEDTEEWQTWEEEEVIETPPEILQALLRSQKQH